MFQEPNINLIIILVAVLILVYLLMSGQNKTSQTSQTSQTTVMPEQFNISPQELDQYYLPGSVDVDDLLVDTMVCHPNCCDDQWPVSYDGLTADEIQNLISPKFDSPYVRTGYTCTSGENGVGCPCITKKAYANLVNRGQNLDDMISSIDLYNPEIQHISVA